MKLSQLVPALAAAALAAAVPPALSQATGAAAPQPPPTAEQSEFFEKKIRPVLVAKCYGCHSSKSKEAQGGLLLDTRDGLLRGGKSGKAVVPGDPGKGSLMAALRHQGLKMPPSEKLPEEVVASFEAWIRLGAPDPRTASASPVEGVDLEKGRRFWAFQPVQRPSPPAVKDGSWPRSELDRFVLRGLEAVRLRPVPDAGRSALLRRLSFDLTGLPPTPEQVDYFLKDTAPNALEKAVDQMLGSPQFGERWGRHWLDVARYAESSGKESNVSYPHAWRYRDYVIASLNADKPYDRFVREQLAGDLLPARDDAQRAQQMVATGFLAIGPKSHNQRNLLQFELDLVDEQIDAFSQAFLGLTIACARCHDHKFDPISQADYYALAGIFRSTETCYGTVPVITNLRPSALIELPAGAQAPILVSGGIGQRPVALASQLDQLRQQERELFAEARRARMEGREFDPGIRLLRLRSQIALIEGQLRNYDQEGRVRALAMGVRERFRIFNSPMYSRGEPDQPGEIVPRGTPRVFQTAAAIPSSTSGRRELAEWIASSQNPLTSRVMVNRIWTHLFGQGIVPTVDNFGVMGQRPTNPALLDYLASRFVEQGWSMKKLIREIVLSRTYGMSGRHDPANYAIDPDNQHLWRVSPRRLAAEEIRDAMLAASGRLDLRAPGGSAVALSGEGLARQASRRSFDEAASGMRSVYLSIVRDQLSEPLAAFDFAHPGQVTGKRDTTSTPTQALYLMNSPLVIGFADTFALRLSKEASRPEEQVRRAYVLAFGRQPTAGETAAALRYLGAVAPDAQPGLATLSSFCHALFLSAEFRHLE